ncbi:MAG: histidine phosphatase family protein, partial [Myxococcota bacterium]
MVSNTITQHPFYFVRHGQTECNRKRVFTGREDIPINAEGVKQAQAAGRLLRGRPIGWICCSPMKRARQTMVAVRQQLDRDPPISFENDLREVCMGALEGYPVWEQGAMAHWLEGRITVTDAET